MAGPWKRVGPVASAFPSKLKRAPRKKRGYEICECFASSGAGFYGKGFPTLNSRGHPLCHPQLLAADREGRQSALQRAAMAKYVSEIEHSRRTLPCVSRPVEASFWASMGQNGASLYDKGTKWVVLSYL